MDLLQKDVEYYEELFPISAQEKSFFDLILDSYTMPAKYLRLGCGTGSLESYIAKLGHDVTAIESSKELLESANLRRRTPDNAIRFFLMSTLEMSRYLGKNFYNIIASLNSRIIFIHDKTLLKKFFYDCKTLLSDNGVIVLSLANFNSIETKNTFAFETLESIRISYNATITKEIQDNEEVYLLSSELINSNGKKNSVIEKEKVYPITKAEIEEFALEAGFNTFSFYSDFEKNPFTDKSTNLICEISR